MTADEVLKEINRSIAPKLQEMGLEAFVLCAYVRSGDGQIDRAVIASDGKNPAYSDGLRPILTVASIWHGHQVRPPPE